MLQVNAAFYNLAAFHGALQSVYHRQRQASSVNNEDNTTRSDQTTRLLDARPRDREAPIIKLEGVG